MASAVLFVNTRLAAVAAASAPDGFGIEELAMRRMIQGRSNHCGQPPYAVRTFWTGEQRIQERAWPI